MNTGNPYVDGSSTIEATDNVVHTRQPDPNDDYYYVLEPFNLAQSRSHTIDYVNQLIDLETSIFGDIRIHVGQKTFTLDRAILASKSPHLQYLILNHDDDKIETTINGLMKGNPARFSAIVGIIYGHDLHRFLDERYFLQLFMDMDRLDMEIDQGVFRNFIDESLGPKVQLNNDMFRWCTYIYSCNSSNDRDHKYDYLMVAISQYFSDRLAQIYRRKEFLSLPCEVVCTIITSKTTVSTKCSLDFVIRVCAGWICQDGYRPSRTKYCRDLVNAIKHRFGLFPFGNWDSSSVIRSLKMNGVFDQPNVELIKNLLFQLIEHIHYHGDVKYVRPCDLRAEICNLPLENRIGRIVNRIDHAAKWMHYFQKRLFCDVIVDVRGFGMDHGLKLHRAKLSSDSEYFYDMFTKSYQQSSDSELEKCSIGGIDPATFKSLIYYIYHQEIEVHSLVELKCLLRGSKLLKMDDLYEKCSFKVLEIINDLPTDDLFYVFQFVCENDKCSELYDGVVARIVDLWPGLDDVPELDEIASAVLREIVALPQLKLDVSDEVER